MLCIAFDVPFDTTRKESGMRNHCPRKIITSNFSRSTFANSSFVSRPTQETEWYQPSPILVLTMHTFHSHSSSLLKEQLVERCQC